VKVKVNEDIQGICRRRRRRRWKKKKKKKKGKNAATTKEWHSHASLPQHVHHTFVSEAHLGRHGYHCHCVLCEERTEAEETVEHRACNTTQQNQMASEINAWITLIKKDRQRRLRKLWRPVIWRLAMSALRGMS
jgi:hypothetical protein